MDPFDPRSTARRDAWWRHSFALAEQAKGGGYHLMPDDYTPGMGGGRSITGHRRTHRMRYEGAGVALRMPSVTSVKRFSQDIGGQTFDIPIEATYPGGSVQGYVRVTPNADGTWSVNAPGMDDPRQRFHVTEAVNAVLEARRPSLALPAIADLAERRRERYAQLGVARLQAPERHSDVVRGATYHPLAEELIIQLGDRGYAYPAAPHEVRQLLEAYAPGAYYNARFRGKRPSARVQQCEQCHRFHSLARPHRCPASHRAPQRLLKFQRLALLEALGVRQRRGFERAAERALEERRDWDPGRLQRSRHGHGQA